MSETLKTGAARRKRKRDKDGEAETPGTDRQGCGERSLISQHHLLPVPGLKAPLMSNLPQPHTSRAPQSRERPHCLFPCLSPAPFSAPQSACFFSGLQCIQDSVEEKQKKQTHLFGRQHITCPCALLEKEFSFKILPLHQFTVHLIKGILIQQLLFSLCWTSNFLDKLSVFNLSRVASIEAKPTGDAGYIQAFLLGEKSPRLKMCQWKCLRATVFPFFFSWWYRHRALWCRNVWPIFRSLQRY